MRSPRVFYPIPTAGSDPWYDSFVDLIGAIDASVYAQREDRNSTMLQDGGVVAYLNGVLTWTDTIRIPNPMVGYFWEIAPNIVGLELEEGEYFYVTLVRAPTQNTALAPKTAFVVPNTDNEFVVGQRRDDRVYFSNGDVLQNGESLQLFSTGGGAGGSSGPVQTVFARFSNVAIGPQGPVKVDVGVATSTFIQASFAIRPDKATTAGTLTVRLGNQVGPLSSVPLSIATNAGVYVVTVNTPTPFTIGDLITLEIETDPFYTHLGAGLAAVRVSAQLS